MFKPAFRRAAFVFLGVAALAVAAAAFSNKRAQESAATPVAQAPADSVWVARADGAESCSPRSGQSLEDGAAGLRKNGIHVLDSRKGNDGKMHMQMCGAPQGTTNAYLIPRSELGQALPLGFRETK